MSGKLCRMKLLEQHPCTIYSLLSLFVFVILTLLGLYVWNTVQNQRHTYHLLIALTENRVPFRWEWKWNKHILETFPSQARSDENIKSLSQFEMLEGAKSMGAGAATIASAGAAVGIGNVFSSLIHSVARNPSLAKQLFGYAILGFALTEAIALGRGPRKWGEGDKGEPSNPSLGNTCKMSLPLSFITEPGITAGIEVSRTQGDAFLERANQKFHFEFRTSTSCCSWCFTISIGNERRSGGTCGTTYWITPVRHEAADADYALLAWSPGHGGGPVARHEHRAKGRWPRYPHLRSDEWRTDPGFHERWRGASAYPGVIITTCTSHLGTAERVTRLLQRGGWHYWQRPSGENAAGAKRGRPEREPGRWKSQGGPGHLTEMEGFSPIREGPLNAAYTRISFRGRAVSISLQDLRMNAGLGHLEWREPHAGRPARTVFRGIWSKDRPAPTRLEGLRN
ncbi:hypothetical protein V8G54_000051 (mitochondrion) [Vigna mungo]|uniref:ATP synthase subunit 9, mitochondrial n=1 Tax=Vigna mungo TaxID=3915 RepID=A0AAQ3SH00_VIGMU